jgi:hypothetical protein
MRAHSSVPLNQGVILAIFRSLYAFTNMGASFRVFVEKFGTVENAGSIAPVIFQPIHLPGERSTSVRRARADFPSGSLRRNEVTT